MIRTEKNMETGTGNRNGIVLVDKPEGMTSHDVVAFIRRRFGFGKVGHAGTLDPMATGLLIILLEKYTKRSSEFLNCDKEYEGTICLGAATDTGDREGNITEKRDIRQYEGNIKNMGEIFRSFLGEIRQIPPMYSAKKINGKKLYELARKGKTLARQPKEVSIKKISVSKIEIPYVKFHVQCSKGTYIRQLAHDIGQKIGCGAHLVSLRRTKIGRFSVDDAVSFEKLKSGYGGPPENVPLGLKGARTIIDENILQP